MTTATTAPALLASARQAGLDYLAQHVAEAHIHASEAAPTLAVALPFATQTIANLRREGVSKDGITEAFQHRLDNARRRHARATTAAVRRAQHGRIVTAGLYLAIWAGMQEDEARFVAALPAIPPLRPRDDCKACSHGLRDVIGYVIAVSRVVDDAARPTVTFQDLAYIEGANQYTKALECVHEAREAVRRGEYPGAAYAVIHHVYEGGHRTA